MTSQECEMHLARRQHEESVESLFQTGFWKYPTSLETQPKEAGGNGLNFHPFVKDEKYSHCSSKPSDDSSAQHDLLQNGPDLSIKTSRKPWLKDGKIMPYLIKSPSRLPLQVERRSVRMMFISLCGSLTGSGGCVSNRFCLLERSGHAAILTTRLPPYRRWMLLLRLSRGRRHG